MDQQVSQNVEQQLRQQWDQLYPQILDRFTTVSKSDIESARTADDLVRRISDKSQFSERYVETQINELVTVGQGSQSAQKAPFSTHQQSPSSQGSSQGNQNR